MCIVERGLRVAGATLVNSLPTVNGQSANLSRLRRLFVLLMAVCMFLFSTAQAANDSTDTSIPNDINLGVVLTDSQRNSLPGHVFTDGTGLPDGKGTSVVGEPLYAQHCASCHGSVGQGGKALELVGDASLLASDYPDRGIGVYWPYASTLYEYINRSMPPATPGMFTVDELYSIIAHLLELNELLEPGFVLDKRSLSGLKLPNRDGFDTIAR
ncbi:MAG: c-type cytochrome [Granulosicoccus sp.]